MKSLKEIVLGKAKTLEQLKEEKMSRIWGLPIMASDAVSSVAYGVQEILMALAPLGIMSVQYVGLVSIPIIILLLILVFSYSQIIKNYPNGGGAYIVSRENFGRQISLLAAACLIVDYIMTVAVSISSSGDAFAAAFPSLEPYKVLIALVSIGVVTLINLRGVRESSKIFGIPTYVFIISMAALIITGLFRLIAGSLPPIEYTDQAKIAFDIDSSLSGITIILFLHAFSSGCSALTGVEAVSNAVPAFREPSVKTARHVLYMLGGIIVFILGGTSFLTTTLHVLPLTDATVISQIGNSIFGNSVMFYILQFSTTLILLLAANTAYNGLPIMLSILAKDRYMPRQFAQRGTKLSFSNGIVFIFIAGAILLIAFGADTHSLIPFYAVGVFVSFTLSQAGMVVKWIRTKGKGWKRYCIINGFGALITLIGTLVVFTMKFLDGAWALLIIIPLIIFFMNHTHNYYLKFGKSIDITGYDYKYTGRVKNNTIPCVVLMHSLNKAALKTFDYARELFGDLTVLHISSTPKHTEVLKKQWEDLKIDVPLTVIQAPYRDIFTPLENYIFEREKTLAEGQDLTFVLTRFVGDGLQNKIYHNQTAFFITNKLRKHKNVATVMVPYYINKK